jgi:hypothetical protein
MAEKMPSSVKLGGSRPMICRMRSYSSGLEPWAHGDQLVCNSSEIGLTLRHGEKAGHRDPAPPDHEQVFLGEFPRTSSTLIRVMEDGGSIRSAIPAKDALSRACKVAASPSRPVFVSTSETIARLPRPKKRPRRISAEVQQGGNEAAVARVSPLMLK